MAISSVRCGVAIFDDVRNPAGGIASLCGDNTFRFTTVGDLPSEHIWITNLTFKDAYAVRLHNNPKIKLSNFFRTELDRLCHELGLDLQTKRNETVMSLSKVSDRVLSLAMSIYGITRFKDSLRKTLEDSILPESEPDHSPLIGAAIDSSFKYHQLCWGKRNPNNINFYLRFPRTKFAQFVSALPVPQGAWQQITDKFPLKNNSVKRGTGSRVYELLEKITARQPALVKIGVADVDPAVAHLLDYGNGTDGREWVPVQEAAQIAAFADVTIHGLIIADGYITLEQSYAKKIHMLDSGQINGLSYGLLAENHLHAIYSKRKLKVNGQYQSITTARASFLRAWDRIACFKTAIQLEKKRFQVLSYGAGTIQVSCSEDQVTELKAAAVELGLSPPIVMNSYMIRTGENSENLNDSLSLLASNEKDWV